MLKYDLNNIILFFLLLFVSFIIALLVFFISYLFVLRIMDLEKISAYECGFEPFEDARGIFDVKFYLVAILFLIFDLEIVFLFPWSVVLFAVSGLSFFAMLFFIVFLSLVYFYEWFSGALDW